MSKADELLRRALGIFHQALGPMEQLPESYNPVKAWCAEARIYLNTAKDPELDAALAAAGITKRDVLSSLDTRNARQFAQSLIDTYDARSELFTNDAALAANLADRARAYLNEKLQPINDGVRESVTQTTQAPNEDVDEQGPQTRSATPSPPHAAAEPRTLSEQLRGFAAYCESVGRGEGFDKDDCTMFAKKFREAADALELPAAAEPEKPVAWMYQYEDERPWFETRQIKLSARCKETPLYASPAQLIARIREAINDYYAALCGREHGGLAQNAAFNKIEQTLGMTWDAYKANLKSAEGEK